MNILIASASLAVPALPLGYPVFTERLEGTCTFQIQDMILQRRDAAEWMEKLPDKSEQIDIVWQGKADKICLRKARSFIREAGFHNVVEREATGLNYGPGLPPP